MRKMKFRSMIKGIVSTMVGVSLLITSNFVPQPFQQVQAESGYDTNLGPVTAKDVIYQIITDRFYDGDTSNNIPDGFDSAYFDGTGSNLNHYQGGDWQGIIDKISYLKKMGITAVWITAPYENREAATISGNNSWVAYHGYHVRNYFAANEHFGTLNEFKELRDELHTNGIKLVIDFVTNHTSDTNTDGKLYEPDLLTNGEYAIGPDGKPYDANQDGIIENLVADPNNDSNGWFHHLGNRLDSETDIFSYRNKDLANLADFSHENSSVVSYLEKAVGFWTKLGIDGIRHDATLHMNPAYVRGLMDATNSIQTVTNFGEFFIGRPSDKYSEYISFPTRTGVNNLDFEFYNAATSTFGNFSTTMSDFGKMLLYTSTDYAYENQTVTFLDNHDVSRFGYIQQNQKPYHAALAVLLTSRGIPNIYYGTEQYINPGTSGNDAGRIFMQTSSDFDENTTAYKVIGTLSGLRQTNHAVAYGTTTILYSDDNVLVFERQFFDEYVVVAANRQPDHSYTISNIKTSLPTGKYEDILDGLLYGDSVTVADSNGSHVIDSLNLQGGEVDIWSYDMGNDSDGAPHVGDVINTMGRAGQKVYISGQRLGGNPTVSFGAVKALVLSANDTEIVAEVPEAATAGINDITVTNKEQKSNVFKYNVLSGDQNQMIFHVNAQTNYGENIYVVGSIPELGSWNPDNCTEAMHCPEYPNWYLPVSVPAGTTFKFKFIKKDAKGNVTWESSSNRVITSSSVSTGVVDTKVYMWSQN
ncbi:alpha-amylase family glycosyl hydrolase [Lachnotalea glycerini]|nr:alpha-amylase family glycosyl hydrolase [Lachnotalea glycerini]